MLNETVTCKLEAEISIKNTFFQLENVFMVVFLEDFGLLDNIIY